MGTNTKYSKKWLDLFLRPQVEKIIDKEIFNATLTSTLLGISKEILYQKLGILKYK